MAKTPRNLITKKITRGPRKGMAVQGYMTASGKFQEATKGGTSIKVDTRGGKTDPAFATDVNAQKGGPREGQKFARMTDKSGRSIHQYSQGGKVQNIVVGKGKAALAKVTPIKTTMKRKTASGTREQ